MPELQKTDNTEIFFNDREGVWSGMASYQPWKALFMVSRGVNKK